VEVLTMNDKDKIIKNDNKNEFLKNEFSQDLFDETAKIGYAPITGGIITRELIKQGEEILQNNDNNSMNSNKLTK
jgi:hypothetical protein